MRTRPSTKLLQHAGLNQRDLATALERSQTWVSLQLSGRRPMSDRLDAALRGVLLGTGRQPSDIAAEIATLRSLVESVTPGDRNTPIGSHIRLLADSADSPTQPAPNEADVGGAA